MAATKPDKMSIENTKPCFFVDILFVVLREIVKMNDKRNRQPAKPVIAPYQNTPVA